MRSCDQSYDDQVLEQAKDTITRLLEPRCSFAYILGSIGTPRFTDSSDIDIAAYFKQPPTSEELAELVGELQDQLHRDVDLVALNRIDPIFARQVLETGRILFCSEPGELLNWKSLQLSLYPDFKTSRAVIEKLLLNRKKYV